MSDDGLDGIEAVATGLTLVLDPAIHGISNKRHISFELGNLSTERVRERSMNPLCCWAILFSFAALVRVHLRSVLGAGGHIQCETSCMLYSQ